MYTFFFHFIPPPPLLFSSAAAAPRDFGASEVASSSPPLLLFLFPHSSCFGLIFHRLWQRRTGGGSAGASRGEGGIGGNGRVGGFGFVGRRGRWREEKIQFHCSLSQVFLLFCFLSFSLFSLFLLLPQGLIFGPSDDDSYREKKRKKSFAFSCSDFSLKKVGGVKNFSFLR